MPSPKRKTLHIEPPLAGVVRKMGFQKQAPYTTIQSVNIWPVNALDNRQVSATRPPLEVFESVDDNINLLCRVTGDGNQDPQYTFVYASGGSLFVWNGPGLGFEQVDTAFAPATIPLVTTGRPVYATSFLKNTIIANDGNPLVYVYDDTIATNRLTYLTATAGTVPQNCRVVATWQGAVWFAGAPDSPHILYASRTGDITDYDYSALPEDEGGAFATILDNEGLIGEPITALMPQTTDTMVIGCNNSMWAIKGHPRRGGSVESLSHSIGPLGQGAWCKAPDNTLYVLTKSGMVTIAPQDGSIPALVSKEKIPNELTGLAFDSLSPTVSMSYDTVWNGVTINVRGNRTNGSWWFDPTYGGFHQMFFDYDTTVMLNFPDLDTATASGMLFGGASGLRRFDAEGVVDTPNYILAIGPIKISPNATLKSKLETLKLVLGLGTVVSTPIADNFAIVWVGSDGEEVYQNFQHNRAGTGFSLTLDSLKNNNSICRPQLSGHAILLVFAGADRVIFESGDIDFVEAGKMRTARNWSIEPRVSAGPDQALEYIP